MNTKEMEMVVEYGIEAFTFGKVVENCLDNAFPGWNLTRKRGGMRVITLGRMAYMRSSWRISWGTMTARTMM